MEETTRIPIKNIRIGFLTYGMHSTITGIGRYTIELTYALKARYPLDIVLISPYPDSPLSWYRDFPVYPVPTLRRLPSVLAFGSAMLSKAAHQLDLDILHDPCGIAPFFGRWPDRVRRIVTIHDAIPLHHPQYQPWLTRFVFGQVLPRMRDRTDAVITDSENARQDLLRELGYRPDQVAVTYPGVHMPSTEELQQWQAEGEATRRQWGIPSPYFLFVSAVSPRKNVPRLLEAFAQVKHIAPTVGLVLVGPSTPEMSSRISQMGDLGQSIFTLGYVDEPSLHRLYANAEAVVYPSLYEGFGLPALEAMAHGTPVITSNTSSLPEVMGNVGWLVDPTDMTALAQAMLAVLQNPQQRDQARVEGRQRAEAFSWQSTAAATWDVYQKVLANNASPPSRSGVPSRSAKTRR